MSLSRGSLFKVTVICIQPNCDTAFISVMFESLTFISRSKSENNWEMEMLRCRIQVLWCRTNHSHMLKNSRKKVIQQTKGKLLTPLPSSKSSCLRWGPDITFHFGNLLSLTKLFSLKSTIPLEVICMNFDFPDLPRQWKKGKKGEGVSSVLSRSSALNQSNFYSHCRKRDFSERY